MELLFWTGGGVYCLTRESALGNEPRAAARRRLQKPTNERVINRRLSAEEDVRIERNSEEEFRLDIVKDLLYERIESSVRLLNGQT